MRLYGGKRLRRAQDKRLAEKRELRDAIVWDINEAGRYCRVKVQGSAQLITAHYSLQGHVRPEALKVGAAVRIASPGGNKGRIEIVGLGLLRPIPVGDAIPSIDDLGDSVLTGLGVTPDSVGGGVSVAAGTYRLAGTNYAAVSADLTFTPTAAGYYRYDLIVVDAAGTPSVSAGTAFLASAPLALQDTPANYVRIGWVLVYPNQATIGAVDVNRVFTAPGLQYMTVSIADRDLAWGQNTTDMTVVFRDQYHNLIDPGAAITTCTVAFTTGTGTVTHGVDESPVSVSFDPDASNTVTYDRDLTATPEISPMFSVTAGSYTASDYIMLYDSGGDLLGGGTPPAASDIGFEAGSGATVVTDLNAAFNYAWSATSVSGFALTNNGDGTVDIAAGETVLRVSASESAQLICLAVAETLNLALTDNSVNYIYVDYNGGTPLVAVGVAVTSFNCLNKCLIWKVVRVGTALKYVDARNMGVDANRKHRRILMLTERYRRADDGGAMISATGTRNIAVSAGTFFFALADDINTSAFDTSTGSTFTYVYQNGSGGYTRTSGQTQIDNTYYDDGSGTLATLGNNKYGVHWVYLCLDTPTVLYVVYGLDSYSSLDEAQSATLPANLPVELVELGVLVGRVIIQKSATAFALLETAFGNTFSVVAAGNLNYLSGGEQTITPADAVTIDWSQGATALLTLNRATTAITMTNGVNGQPYRLRLIQSGTGRLATFTDTIVWTGKTTPTLMTADADEDIITFLRTGGAWRGSDTPF